MVGVGVPNHRMRVGARVVGGVRAGSHRVIRFRVPTPPCGLHRVRVRVRLRVRVRVRVRLRLRVRMRVRLRVSVRARVRLRLRLRARLRAATTCGDIREGERDLLIGPMSPNSNPDPNPNLPYISPYIALTMRRHTRGRRARSWR